MAIKSFVLDTNVLLHDPDSMFAFKDNKVVIPLTVIEELDNFKKLNDERGRGARLISRRLDDLRAKGKLTQGVPLKNGGTLVIEMIHKVDFPEEFTVSKSDHQILSIALYLKQKGENVIFITKDINLRIKAEILDIVTQDYEKSKVKIDEIYRGWKEIQVSPEKIDKFYKNGKVDVPKNIEFYANEFVYLKDENGTSKSALGKYVADKKIIQPL